MLAPLRDHFRPKDPASSPLLCATKDCYLARMSDQHHPNPLTFEYLPWIITEDANVEHLLDAFLSVNPDSGDIWEACSRFMDHLQRYNPRRTVLRKKIEGLPDNHPFKPRLLFELSFLFGTIANHAEETSLLNHALKLERERGDEMRVALVLNALSDASREQGRYKDGIHQMREALDIFERLGDTLHHAKCSSCLARLFQRDGQLDAAEETIFKSTNLHPEQGRELLAYESHQVLGDIYHSKDDREQAIYHYKVALGIASTSNWAPCLFGINSTLAMLYLGEDGFDNAQVHIEQAKLHALDNTFYMGSAALLQARAWYQQHKLEEAASEALHAQEIFEAHGALENLEICRSLLQEIKEAAESPPPPSCE